MESEKPSQAEPLADETRTPNAEGPTAQPTAPKKFGWKKGEKRGPLTAKQKAHLSALARKRWEKKKKDDKRQAIINRRRKAAVNRPGVQERRMHAVEHEQPEPPQPPTDERNPAGTGLAWRGLYNLLPTDVQVEMEEFKNELIADLGGEAELSALKKQYVKMLAQSVCVRDLFIRDLQARGLLTLKGKMRSTVEGLFKAIDRTDKLAQRIGLERKLKKVPTSIEEFMQSENDAVIDLAPEGDDDDA
jgi:hypothetical protein